MAAAEAKPASTRSRNPTRKRDESEAEAQRLRPAKKSRLQVPPVGSQPHVGPQLPAKPQEFEPTT